MSFTARAADPSEIGIDDPTSGGAPAGPDPVALPEPAVSLARSAAVEEAGGDSLVGEYLGGIREDVVAVTAAFAAADRGYQGWYWSVTIAIVGFGSPAPEPPTVSEVVLLPGERALRAPAWVPWDRRIRAGDVGAGDLLATPADDPRLVPSYVDSHDPAVRELAQEFGFGRVRVLSREGRDDAAQRWHDGPFGPDDVVAQQAQAHCLTCGFYVPLAGLLGMALGACSNEFSPADGRVVDAEYGCGAHSDTVIDAPLMSASTDNVVDELTLEVHSRPAVVRVDPEVITEATEVITGATESTSVQGVTAEPDAASTPAFDVEPDVRWPDPTVPTDIGFGAEPEDVPDAEPFDAEPFDAEPFDAEPFDAEPVDAEAAAVPDAGPVDAAPVDAEPAAVPDAGPVDGGPTDDLHHPTS